MAADLTIAMFGWLEFHDFGHGHAHGQGHVRKCSPEVNIYYKGKFPKRLVKYNDFKGPIVHGLLFDDTPKIRAWDKDHKERPYFAMKVECLDHQEKVLGRWVEAAYCLGGDFWFMAEGIYTEDNTPRDEHFLFSNGRFDLIKRMDQFRSLIEGKSLELESDTEKVYVRLAQSK